MQINFFKQQQNNKIKKIMHISCRSIKFIFKFFTSYIFYFFESDISHITK